MVKRGREGGREGRREVRGGGSKGKVCLWYALLLTWME